MSTRDGENDIERGVYQTPSNDDDLYDDYDDEVGMGRGPLIAIFGVVMAASLIGAVWLGIQLGSNQNRAGTPPIISASADPFKTEPMDPGGMPEPVVSITGNTIAGEEMEEVTQVVPSSEEPLALPQTRPEEVQMAANEAVESAPELRTSTDEVGTSGGLVVPRPSERVRNAESNTDLRQNSGSTTPETNSSPAARAIPRETQPEPEVQSPPPQEVIIQTPPVVQDASIGPQLLDTQGPVLAAANTGNYVVQVASFPEIPDATAAWTRLQSRHAAIVGDHVQDIQDVDLGARGTWYRLRIGYFETRSDAVALCEQLQANNQDCLVASR